MHWLVELYPMKCKHLESTINRDGKECRACGLGWRFVIAKKRMKKRDKRRRVWITQPQVHGNGGWCGDTILSESSMPLHKALAINPESRFDIYQDWREYGRLGATRISTKPDSNKGIYYWHGDDQRWYELWWETLTWAFRGQWKLPRNPRITHGRRLKWL